MISNDLLEKLVAFKHFGTLAKAAEHLLVTQPTLTRSMQQLENELGVQLFIRHANRISLTETGELATKEAEKLLHANEMFTTTIKNFANRSSQLHVAATIPAPIRWLSTFTKIDVKTSPILLGNSNIISSLSSYQNDLVFSTEEIQTDEIESLYLGKECLKVLVSPNSTIATKSKIHFSDLNGQNILVLEQIGIWKEIIENNIVNGKLMYQNSLNNLDIISNSTNFIVFRSNLTVENYHLEKEDDNRILIPIVDEAAKIDCYANYLKTNKNRVSSLLTFIAESWPH